MFTSVDLVRAFIIAVIAGFPAHDATVALQRFEVFQFKTRAARWSLVIAIEIAAVLLLEVVIEYAYLTLK